MASIILLVVSYFFDAKAWHTVCTSTAPSIAFKTCFTSVGLSVFNKYVPGKVWALASRSNYLHTKTGHSLTDLSIATVFSQLVAIWSALAIVIAVGGESSPNIYWDAAILVAFVATSIAVFLLFGKRLSLSHKVKACAWYSLHWLFVALAFYVLLLSTGGQELKYGVGLMYVAATIMGIVAIFAPGGLGIREGTLVFLLASHGYSTVEASSIAVGSRIWAHVAEACMFCIGLIFARKQPADLLPRQEIERESTRGTSSDSPSPPKIPGM